jgi:hypothetical protein
MTRMKRLLQIAIMTSLGLGLASPAAAQDVRELPLVTTAKKIDLDAGEEEIRDEARHLRFCVPKEWDVKHGAGIWIIASKDKKFLSVITLLDDPKEVPGAIEEIDQLVGVTATEFSKPKAGMHRGIITELLNGRGLLARSKKEVDVSVLTMFVFDAPVLVTILVHADAVQESSPAVKRFLESFALLVSPEEAKRLSNREKRVDPAALK